MRLFHPVALALVLVAIAAAALLLQPPAPGECSVDKDCSPAGCSGQLCVPVSQVSQITTTCEWLPEYECLRLTGCGCVDGRCQWKASPEYMDCLESLK